MKGHSRYNTITKRFREEIFECILSRTNAKPSFLSSDTVYVLNPVPNLKELFPKMSRGGFVRELHNDMKIF